VFSTNSVPFLHLYISTVEFGKTNGRLRCTSVISLSVRPSRRNWAIGFPIRVRCPTIASQSPVISFILTLRQLPATWHHVDAVLRGAAVAGSDVPSVYRERLSE